LGAAVGAWVPVSQLADEEVTAFRQLEEDKIGQVLDDLLDICKSQKVGTGSSCVAYFDPQPLISFQQPACPRCSVLMITSLLYSRRSTIYSILLAAPICCYTQHISEFLTGF
jgi:hypothetical protein